MPRRLRNGALVPAGLVVEQVDNAGAVMEIAVRSAKPYSRCPSCDVKAAAVHSHYSRRLGDLPLAGRSVRLVLNARRFRCRKANRARRISPSASIQRSWNLGRAEPVGSVYWSFISAWHLAAGPALVLPIG